MNVYRQAIPHPDPEVEERAKGPSEVVSYILTQEEILAIYGPAKKNGKKPTCLLPQRPTIKETIDDMKHPQDLTKAIYDELKAAGKKNAQIEREYGMKSNYIYNLIKSWKAEGDPAALIKQQMTDPAHVDEIPKREAPKPKVQSEKITWKIAEKVDTIVERQEAPHLEPAIVERKQVEPAKPHAIVRDTPVAKCKRTMKIEATGDAERVTQELRSLSYYVQAVDGGAYKLEITLVEV
jgi:transposase